MSAITTTRPNVPFIVPLLNPLVSLFIRLGLAVGPPMALITVRGRTTGLPRTTPVSLFERDGQRYLFATFGNTSWVRNVRAAGELTLGRGGRREDLAAVPLRPEEAAPILRACLMTYLRNPMMAPFLRRFYGVGSDTSVEAFVEVGRHHPAFELREKVVRDGR